MPQFTPAMVKLFTDKEKLVNSYPMTYITNPEKEIIYAVVSAANNCEMCLSFHAMGMGQTLSPEDNISRRRDMFARVLINFATSATRGAN